MLADKPVSFIYGVGPATAEKLSQRGFRTDQRSAAAPTRST